MSKKSELYQAEINVYQIGCIIKRTNPTVKIEFHSLYELGACMQSAFPEKYETFNVIRYLSAEPLIFNINFLQDFCYTFHLDQDEFTRNFKAIETPQNYVARQFIPLRHIQLHRELRERKK